MKFFLNNLLITVFVFIVADLYAQDIQVISHETFIYELPGGTTDIAFHFEAINISNEEQIVFLVRTINDLPFPAPEWTSSLCFGELCFPSDVDSVATDGGANPPLAPNDTHIQVQLGTFRHPDERDTLDFIATTDPSVDVEEETIPSGYYLLQNYPNPFNPSTKINYKVGEPGLVQLKVYNVLGIEVATLVNEYKNSGNYLVDFNALDLSSGVYLYSLSINNFTQTRKMILEK